MDRIVKTLTTPAARSSAIYYFGSFAVGIGRYFFHLILLRLLLPSEYGEFIAYLSLLYLLGIPNSTIGSVVIKFVALFRGKKDNASINRLFYFLVKKLTPITLAISALLIVTSNVLAQTLKAHPTAFIILGISVLLGPLSSIIRGYLTAYERFAAQIVMGGIEVSLTIILAIIFINARLSATGAVSAQIVAGIVTIAIMFYLVRKLIYPPLKNGKIKINLTSFTGYSLIFAIGSLSLISTDVLAVRYFMSEYLSGIYSSLSVIGRSIYFILGPLIGLILPYATHRHTATKSARSVFVKLGAAIIFFGLGAAGLFSLFPQFIISLVSGANYLEATTYLPLFSWSILFFSLNLFIISYFMAVGFPQANLYLLAATIFQPILIFIFHKNISQVVNINLFLEATLFLILLWQVKRKKI